MTHPKANVEDRQLRESVGNLADWIFNHPSYTQAQLEGKVLALIEEQVDRARVDELRRLSRAFHPASKEFMGKTANINTYYKKRFQELGEDLDPTPKNSNDKKGK